MGGIGIYPEYFVPFREPNFLTAMWFIYILGGILLLIILGYLLGPATYDVSRTIEINRTPEDVFEYLKYL